jgi:hypothetical protein
MRLCSCVPFPEELGVRLNKGGSFKAGVLPVLSMCVDESLEEHEAHFVEAGSLI